MSRAKREQIVLGLLGAVLLYAGWNLWQTFRPVRAPVAQTMETAPSAGFDTDPFSSVSIPSDWAGNIVGPDSADGRDRDPFRYGASTPVRPPAATSPTEPPAAQTFSPPPPRPAAPPPLPLQYVGYSRIGGAGAGLRAILVGADRVPYPAQAGDTVLGRYRVEEVTEEFAVVEDLQSGRRERLLVSLQD